MARRFSIKAVTGKPIKFCGTGEKSGDIEPFYPDRMASRILGMGDVLTLIEKAQSAASEEEMKKMEKKLRESSFTSTIFCSVREYEEMGNINDLIGMMPGMSGMKISDKDIDEARIEKFKAIIRSMTKQEREHPEIIKSTRRKRIADGSGTTVQDVNQLLKQFDQTKELMKRCVTAASI